MIIYRLISPSKKSYIGKTSNTFKIRFGQHIRAWKSPTRKYSSKLYNAFNKYPPETWKQEIIYSCLNEDLLNEKEKYFIKYYDSINFGYNITAGGDGGAIPFTNERRLNHSIIMKGKNTWSKNCKLSKETILKRNITNFGRKRSLETRNNISKSLLGKHPTKEIRNKISNGLKIFWANKKKVVNNYVF